jgi:hypothetical protein
MSSPVRIPADVDRPDRIVAGLTGRQLLILASAATILYLGWTATRSAVPLPVFVVAAIPIGGGAVALALGKREGVSLDRLLLAAVRQRLQPRHRVAAPEGLRPVPQWMAQRAITAENPHRPVAPRAGNTPAALHLPAESVTDAGMVDLGRDGIAAVAVAGTVNFGLRTPAEQDALIATFARWLHSLTSPVQILIRAERLDLSGQIADLHAAAPALPHAALEHAAREHADYLAHLAAGADLLRRQVLLVLREPNGLPSATGTRRMSAGGSALATPSALAGASSSAGRRSRSGQQSAREVQQRAAEGRLARRLAEAIDLLAPAGIVVTALDAGQATAVLAAACNPDSLVPPSTGVAGADEVITTSAEPFPSSDTVGGAGWSDSGDWPQDSWNADPRSAATWADAIDGGHRANNASPDWDSWGDGGDAGAYPAGGIDDTDPDDTDPDDTDTEGAVATPTVPPPIVPPPPARRRTRCHDDDGWEVGPR